MKIRNRKSAIHIIADAVIAVVLSAAAIITAVFIVRSSDESRKNENLRIIENGVRKAATECYAVEGFYPESIEYLKENYSLYIDEKICIVHYNPVSSNIMPDIRVLAK